MKYSFVKKTLAMLLTIALACTVFTACGKETDEKSGSEASGSEASGSEEGDASEEETEFLFSSMTTYDPDGKATSKITREYNDAGLITKESSYTVNDKGELYEYFVTETEYNENGNVLKYKFFNREVPDAELKPESEYDIIYEGEAVVRSESYIFENGERVLSSYTESENDSENREISTKHYDLNSDTNEFEIFMETEMEYEGDSIDWTTMLTYDYSSGERKLFETATNFFDGEGNITGYEYLYEEDGYKQVNEYENGKMISQSNYSMGSSGKWELSYSITFIYSDDGILSETDYDYGKGIDAKYLSTYDNEGKLVREDCYNKGVESDELTLAYYNIYEY